MKVTEISPLRAVGLSIVKKHILPLWVVAPFRSLEGEYQLFQRTAFIFKSEVIFFPPVLIHVPFPWHTFSNGPTGPS